MRRYNSVIENSSPSYPSLAPPTHPPPPPPLLLHASPVVDHTGEQSGTCKRVLPEGSAPTTMYNLQLPPRQLDQQMAVLQQVKAAWGGHKKMKYDCGPKLEVSFDCVRLPVLYIKRIYFKK